MLYIILALAVSILFGTANAHTHLYSMTINGTVLERGECIRPYESNFNFPAKNPNSKDMVCRTTDMSSKSTDTCGVAAGSTITLEWHEEDDRGSRGIEGEHWGPCLVYLAPLESNGEGSVWFKIFELGYDTKTKDWCIDVFNRQQGKLDIEIPSDIKQGAYLMRTEIIALHLAERVYGEDAKGGAEYYSNCAQLYIIGDGTAEPEGVAIPGVYDKNEPGIHFSLWDGFKSYPIPGPKLYTAGSLANTNNDNMVLDYVDDSSEIEKPSVVEKAPKPSRVSSKSNCVQRRRLRRRRAMERKHLRIKDDL